MHEELEATGSRDLETTDSTSSEGPSRKVRVSNFDSQALRSVWKDEEEKKIAEATIDKMASSFSTIIKCLGDPHPEREGLQKTPLRAARALCFFTKGYEEDIESK